MYTATRPDRHSRQVFANYNYNCKAVYTGNSNDIMMLFLFHILCFLILKKKTHKKYEIFTLSLLRLIFYISNPAPKFLTITSFKYNNCFQLLFTNITENTFSSCVISKPAYMQTIKAVDSQSVISCIYSIISHVSISKISSC